MCTKHCSKCKIEKNYSEFSPSTTGKLKLSSWCKKCKADKEQTRRIDLGVEVRKKRNPNLKNTGNKECLYCFQILPLNNFAPTKRGIDGVAAYCNICLQVRRKLNPDYRKLANNYVANYRKRQGKLWNEKHCQHQQKRRALKAQASIENISKEAISALYAQEICAYCKQQIARSKRSIDHVIPLCRGGAHSLDNLVMACISCNSSKRNKTGEEFKKWIEQKL